MTHIFHQSTGHAVTVTCFEEGSDVFLSPCDGLTTHGQSWMLDYRIDGAFLIVSTSTSQFVVTCDNATSSLENTKLTMRRFTGEDNQLWRFDGGYIESVKFEGYVISSPPNGQGSLVLCIKEAGNDNQSFEHKVRVLHIVKPAYVCPVHNLELAL